MVVLSVLLAFVGVSVYSVFRGIYWGDWSRQIFIEVSVGVFVIEWGEDALGDAQPDCFSTLPYDKPVKLLTWRQVPRVSLSPTVNWMTIPLWIPVAVLLLIWRLGNRRNRRRESAGQCYNCDYDLCGNTTGRCPECGHFVETTRRN